ncbi:DUF6215 domain-containing protein [Streptomyces sp. NPDC048514]|uniref:DUF6215 domain-containing protein n=1 Tax=Streptomyces sp. NPDC048514 TaxID=3365564 RepID=UPI00371E0843
MLGFLIRRLPFWVREPLLIVVGSVFGVRIMYLAVRDHDRVAFGIGAVFLVFTAVRVHSVVRALQARRKRKAAASAEGAAVDAAAQPQAEAPPQPRPRHGTAPGPSPAAAEKEHNAWAQAATAVGVFGAIAGTIWLLPHVMPSDDDTARPASCSSEEREKLPKVYRERPEALTGYELCEALNRHDLARLLGTPGETATTASGTSNTAPLTDGKVARPEAEVMFDTYTVNISATYGKRSVAQDVKVRKIGGEEDVRTATVLGRPAVFSSEHTIKFEIDLGSGGPVQQGPLARTLSVALDRNDRGGNYDITVWSESGALPDDSVLRDIAEKILPSLPARAT